MRLSSLAVALAAAKSVHGLFIPTPGSSEYQHLALINRDQRALTSRDTNSTLDQERAAAVKDAFTFAWDGYFTTCKGQDELEPVTGTWYVL